MRLESLLRVSSDSRRSVTTGMPCWFGHECRKVCSNSCSSGAANAICCVLSMSCLRRSCTSWLMDSHATRCADACFRCLVLCCCGYCRCCSDASEMAKLSNVSTPGCDSRNGIQHVGKFTPWQRNKNARKHLPGVNNRRLLFNDRSSPRFDGLQLCVSGASPNEPSGIVLGKLMSGHFRPLAGKCSATRRIDTSISGSRIEMSYVASKDRIADGDRCRHCPRWRQFWWFRPCDRWQHFEKYAARISAH
jgi:hypothetical protein